MPGYQRRPDLTTLIINNHRSRRRMRPDAIGRVTPRNLIFDRGFANTSSRGQRDNHQRLFQRRHFQSSHLGPPPVDTNNILCDDDWSSQQDQGRSEPGPSRTVHNNSMVMANSLVEVDQHPNNDLNINNQNLILGSSSGGGGQGQNNNNNGQQQAAPAVRLVDPPVQRLTICDHILMIGARNFFIPKVPRSRRCVNRYKKAGFYVCMISTVTCLFLFWNALVHPYPMIGRQFFCAEKFKQMFVTDDDYYPIFAMLVIFHTLILSAYAVHYTHRPEYDSGFYMYIHSARCLILFGFCVLTWYTYAHASNYPDSAYAKYLEKIMQNTLTQAQIIKKEQWQTIHDPHKKKLVSTPLPRLTSLRIWDDTQTIFKCCGINSFEDWFPNGFHKADELEMTRLSLFEKYVPKSCCKKSQSTTEHSCDALHVHKKGCLQSQLELLLHEAIWAIHPGLLFAVMSHLAFYLILGRIFSHTVARFRRRRPFELVTAAAPAPVPVPVANNDNNANAEVVPI